MPGNIIQADPNGVMPQSLSTAFTESRNFEQLQVSYHDGTIDRGQLAQTSRRTFTLTKRLNAADLATLYGFWAAQNGGLTCFLFYNPFEPAPGQPIGSNYDPTGAETQGRYTVVFRNTAWSQSSDVCRTNIPIELVEVD
jgi:hypothetical protein